MNFVALLVGGLLAAVVSAFVIWLVGKLGLGMEVDGFGAAFLAALLMAVFTAIINGVLGMLNIEPHRVWLSVLVHVVTSIVALILAGAVVKGLRVKGFLGGFLAVVGMSAVGVLLNWLVQLIF
jgi:putative membrane protein